jgi:large subunit ribosomal protein L21
VIIFKKKRRKGYQKWNNHRQSLTQILIQGVLGKGDKLGEELTAERKVRVQGMRPKPAAEVAEVKEVEETPAPKKAARKTAPKAEGAPKKAAAKKSTKKKED